MGISVAFTPKLRPIEPYYNPRIPCFWSKKFNQLPLKPSPSFSSHHSSISFSLFHSLASPVMFLKKSSQKSRKRRPSYIFFCFNGSAIAESADLEAVAAATGKARKRGGACISWFWFQRKKKPLEKASNEHGAKEKIYRSRRSIEPEKFAAAAAAAAVTQVKPEPHPPQLPLMTPKYDAQTRPESSILQTEPASNRRKRGRPEPDQQSTNQLRVKPPAPSKRAVKLDSRARLTLIGVTLAVMVFYGRAAAVVSLCACFYLAAIMRQPLADELDMGKMDGAVNAEVDWEEYKKKVVMEGLLNRSKRRIKIF